MVENLKSYIKDTTDFLNKLEKINRVPEGAVLVIMDVTSLYTNIPHNEGINATTLACEENDSIETSTRVITKFLSPRTQSKQLHIQRWTYSTNQRMLNGIQMLLLIR